MPLLSRPAHGLVVAFVLALLAAHAAPAQTASGPPGDDFTLPSEARVPFLVMRQIPTELAGGHAVVLRVFADGRCELDRPPIMRGAGRHEWTIPPNEVRALARQAIDAGLPGLDMAALRASLRSKHARESQQGSFHVLDDGIVELELRLDRYRPRGRAAVEKLERRIRFVGLRQARGRNPDDARVVGIGALHDRLDAMARERAPMPGAGAPIPGGGGGAPGGALP